MAGMKRGSTNSKERTTKHSKRRVLRGSCDVITKSWSTGLKAIFPSFHNHRQRPLPSTDLLKCQQAQNRVHERNPTSLPLDKRHEIPSDQNSFIRFPLLDPTREEIVLLDKIKKSGEYSAVISNLWQNEGTSEENSLPTKKERPKNRLPSIPRNVHLRQGRHYNSMDSVYFGRDLLVNRAGSLSDPIDNPERVSPPRMPSSVGHLMTKAREKVILPSKYGFHPRSNSPTYKILDGARYKLDSAFEDSSTIQAEMDNKGCAMPFEHVYNRIIKDEDDDEEAIDDEVDQRQQKRIHTLEPTHQTRPSSSNQKFSLSVHLPPLDGSALPNSNEEPVQTPPPSSRQLTHFTQELANIKQVTTTKRKKSVIRKKKSQVATTQVEKSTRDDLGQNDKDDARSADFLNHVETAVQHIRFEDEQDCCASDADS